MKTLMAAVVVAAATVIGSGAALAGKGDRHPSLLREAGKTAAEQGAFQRREPLAAGNIPSREGGMSSGSEFRGGEEVPTVESGGLKYRLEIDVGA